MTDAAAPIVDVHGHFLPPEAVPLMAEGRARVALEDVGGRPGTVTQNGMLVGSTIHALSSAEQNIADMDRARIDARVVSPPPFTFRYWADPRDGRELCRLLNERTAEFAAARPDRFVGLATVPLQDTGAAVEELERAVLEFGLRGVIVGTIVGERNLSDRELLPFFEAVSELDVPVLVHPDFVPNPRLADFYLINLIGMPVETGTAMGNLVFSGVFERLPGLRVCFSHAGGVGPYLFGRWRKGWEVRPESRERIARSPEEYTRLLYCDTISHSPEALAYLVRVLGASRVLLGTDHPFDVQDVDPRGTVAAAPGLSDEDRWTIERGAPREWLGGGATAKG